MAMSSSEEEENDSLMVHPSTTQQDGHSTRRQREAAGSAEIAHQAEADENEAEDEEEEGESEPSASQKLWPVKAILAEKKNKYLLEWEGDDGNGQPWKPTWESKDCATAPLIREWEEAKAAKLRSKKAKRKTSKQPTTSRSTSSTAQGERTIRKRSLPAPELQFDDEEVQEDDLPLPKRGKKVVKKKRVLFQESSEDEENAEKVIQDREGAVVGEGSTALRREDTGGELEEVEEEEEKSGDTIEVPDSQLPQSSAPARPQFNSPRPKTLPASSSSHRDPSQSQQHLISETIIEESSLEAEEEEAVSSAKGVDVNGGDVSDEVDEDDIISINSDDEDDDDSLPQDLPSHHQLVNNNPPPPLHAPSTPSQASSSSSSASYAVNPVRTHHSQPRRISTHGANTSRTLLLPIKPPAPLAFFPPSTLLPAQPVLSQPESIQDADSFSSPPRLPAPKPKSAKRTEAASTCSPSSSAPVVYEDPQPVKKMKVSSRRPSLPLAVPQNAAAASTSAGVGLGRKKSLQLELVREQPVAGSALSRVGGNANVLPQRVSPSLVKPVRQIATGEGAGIAIPVGDDGGGGNFPAERSDSPSNGSDDEGSSGASIRAVLRGPSQRLRSAAPPTPPPFGLLSGSQSFSSMEVATYPSSSQHSSLGGLDGAGNLLNLGNAGVGRSLARGNDSSSAGLVDAEGPGGGGTGSGEIARGGSQLSNGTNGGSAPVVNGSASHASSSGSAGPSASAGAGASFGGLGNGHGAGLGINNLPSTHNPSSHPPATPPQPSTSTKRDLATSGGGGESDSDPTTVKKARMAPPPAQPSFVDTSLTSPTSNNAPLLSPAVSRVLQQTEGISLPIPSDRQRSTSPSVGAGAGQPAASANVSRNASPAPVSMPLVVELIKASTSIGEHDATKAELIKFVQDPSGYAKAGGPLKKKPAWAFELRKFSAEKVDVLIVNTDDGVFQLKRLANHVATSIDVSKSITPPPPAPAAAAPPPAQVPSVLLPPPGPVSSSAMPSVLAPVPAEVAPIPAVAMTREKLESEYESLRVRVKHQETELSSIRPLAAEAAKLRTEVASLSRTNKSLSSSKESATADFTYIQRQYQEASNAAVARANEALVAEAEVARLSTMLKTGLDQRTLFQKGESKRLNEEIARLKTEIKLLKTERLRTDDRTVRENASKWCDHEARLKAEKVGEDMEESDEDEDVSSSAPVNVSNTSSNESMLFACEWRADAASPCRTAVKTREELRQHILAEHLPPPIPKIASLA